MAADRNVWWGVLTSGAALAVILAACGSSGSVTTTSVPTTTAAPTTATRTTTAPTMTTLPTAIGTTTHAPATTSPADDPLAAVTRADLFPIFESPPAPPAGHRWVSILVDEGYGSMRVAIPESWTEWTLTSDPGPFVAVAATKDEGYAAVLALLLADSNSGAGPTTSMVHALDAETDSLLNARVSLSALPPGTTEANLQQALVDSFTALGIPVAGTGSRPSEWGRIATIEVRVPTSLSTFDHDIVELHAYLADEGNGMLWDVSCFSTPDQRAELVDACRAIQQSFVPFGPVVPPS